MAAIIGRTEEIESPQALCLAESVHYIDTIDSHVRAEEFAAPSGL
jgi:hypothetical protein